MTPRRSSFSRLNSVLVSSGRGAIYAAAALSLFGVQFVATFAAAEPASATQPAATSPATAKVQSQLSLDDAIVIGASVSDGFMSTWDVPLSKPSPAGATRSTRALKMRDVLWALTSKGGTDGVAVSGTTQQIKSKASMMFFMSATDTAEQQIQAAKAPGVSHVFAIDYLFWHCYGTMPEAERLGMLAEGFKRLESLGDKVPVVIGDMPDMRHATMMLQPSQIPSVETLAKANAQIAAWVKGRKNVVVIPLTKLVLDVRAGKGIELGGTMYDKDAAKTLLQADGLHATVPGMVAVAIDSLTRLRDAGLIDKSLWFETDPKAAISRLSTVALPSPPAPPGKPAVPVEAAPPPGGK